MSRDPVVQTLQQLRPYARDVHPPPDSPAYQSTAAYSHYSLLRTIEAAWGMRALGEAQHAQVMADFFVRETDRSTFRSAQ